VYDLGGEEHHKHEVNQLAVTPPSDFPKERAIGLWRSSNFPVKNGREVTLADKAKFEGNLCQRKGGFSQEPAGDAVQWVLARAKK
jgi:hypothetical protein